MCCNVRLSLHNLGTVSHVYTDLGHRFDNDTPIEETVCILT